MIKKVFVGVDIMETILSYSYGKDSGACFGACQELGIKIDRVVTVDLWATPDIPADLPPVIEFKKHADEIIKKRFNLTVEHINCTSWNGIKKDNVTYFDCFSKLLTRGKRPGTINGFPMIKGGWCVKMKTNAMRNIPDGLQILGIASDEYKRIERHSKRESILLPLVELGWSENDCFNWCLKNDLLSPTYNTSSRGGCWFCHNQSIDQLRQLYNNYPDLWSLLLSWDKLSPISFKPGLTVADFDKRFYLENNHHFDFEDNFRWSFCDDLQLNFLNYRSDS